MRRDDAPITTDILLIGGGHAHALLLKRWAMAPLPGARLTLVNPDPTAPYTGMLPGHVAGHYARAELEIDLVRLARGAGARLILDRAVGLDPDARRLILAERPPIAYDVASLNIGITSEVRDLPGADAHIVPAKPLGPFAAAWERFVARVAAGEAQPEAAVIGAGVGGVELALAMAHRLLAAAPSADIRLTLVEAAPQILPDVHAGLARQLRARLAAAGVAVRESARIAAAAAEGLRLESGETLPAGFIAAAAGARPQPWLAGTGLALHEGFVRVDRNLCSVSHPTLLAAGDAAHMDETPRKKAGVYAVRQAPILAENLARAVSGRPLRAFRPQSDFLKLISLGPREAIADKWGLALGGPFAPWLWRWKDRIDRRFMERLNRPPRPMTPPRPAGPEALGVAELRARDPLCGGCGSKVGPAALAGGLSALSAPGRDDVERAPGDDAAILRFGQARAALTVDQFRAFIEDPYEFARIAALHALGDVWAMGGEPQAALASVILPPMSPAKQAETLREILAGAEAALGPAGAALAGGHTAAGAELSLGFSVTGLVERPIALNGARAGDVLILTKPIGVGAILAAEMRGQVDGEDWAAALRLMRRSNGPAAAILRRSARAMTDVTGFGLAGHLLNLLKASDVAAALDLDAVPVAQGADALAAAGIRSSLFPENKAAVQKELQEEMREELSPETSAPPRVDLLFDPQTAGGLLAALPAAEAEAALAELRAAEEPAWRVGEILAATPGAPRLRLVSAHSAAVASPDANASTIAAISSAAAS